jgi:hypothetical protein
MFNVRQKVVCVDDYPRVSRKQKGWFSRFRRYTRLDHNLNKGDVYTVVAVTQLTDAETGVVFETLFVDNAWHFGHPGFAHEILRKVGRNRSQPVKVRA